MDNQIQKQNQGITIIEPSAIDLAAMKSLLPAEKKMIEAALQPKIADQNPEDVEISFIAIISTAFTRAGYKMPDSATIAIYAEELNSSLLDKFPRVSIPEVREALKEGVYGEYGEFTGLNPKTFMQFIKGYIASEARKEAVKQFHSKRLYISQTRNLSESEREVYNKEFVNELYADHLKEKLVSDYIPAFIYDFLENQGLIKITLHEKQKINERAKQYFTRLKSSHKYKGNTKSIQDEMKAYIQNRDEDLTIKNISKQFAVFDFFEQCKKDRKTTIFSIPKLLK